MTTASINYKSLTSIAAITATLTSLADGGYRESAGVDNATELFIDALVAGSIQVGAVTADGTIKVYAYASMDNGVIYDGGLIGTDETIVWGTTPSTSSVEGFKQLKLLDVISVDTTDDDNDIEFVCKNSVASVYGGVMPLNWGVVILNDTGVAFHATGTSNSLGYQGIKYDNA